jgi:hypothetical protein
MPSDALSLIINILFYLIVGAFILVSLLGMFIVLKYGRTKAVAFLGCLVFAGTFGIILVSAFITLQLIV